MGLWKMCITSLLAGPWVYGRCVLAYNTIVKSDTLITSLDVAGSMTIMCSIDKGRRKCVINGFFQYLNWRIVGPFNVDNFEYLDKAILQNLYVLNSSPT